MAAGGRSIARMDRLPDVAGLLPAGTVVAPLYQRIAARLASWNLAEEIIAVGMLMRLIERGTITASQVTQRFGADAGTLAAALAQFAGPTPRPSLQQIAPIWKLWMLCYLAPTAAMLKITELLSRLDEADEADPRTSPEVLIAAAHACARLGMWNIRTPLLDAHVYRNDPLAARAAQRLLEDSAADRKVFFTEMSGDFDALLRSRGLMAKIDRRPWSVSKIVSEGREAHPGHLPWLDVVALILATDEECYRALGAINGVSMVIGSRLRDYIGGPKANGYQAIHTLIERHAAPFGNYRIPIDIRLLTGSMDRFNHNGILADLTGQATSNVPTTWREDRQYLIDAYNGRSQEIFVFTPKGEAILLPIGATVIDFAVNVHSSLGVYCRGALVNGHRSSPGELLACGDVCEVLHEQHEAAIDPRLLDQASSTGACSHIRRDLQKDHRGVERGRKIFREVLTRQLAEQQINVSEVTIEQRLAEYCAARRYWNADVYYRAVARGEEAPDFLARLIIEHLLVPRIDLAALPPETIARINRIRLAVCCRPHPPHIPIAIEVQGGRQLAIHRADCAEAAGRGMPLAWKPTDDHAHVADVIYEGWDQPGLIHTLTSALEAVGSINIRAFEATVPEPHLARIRFSFETAINSRVDAVRRALDALPGRRHVEIQAVTVIDEGVHINQPLDNPYSLQPVGRWPLFVGRDTIVNRIVARLDEAGTANHVLLHGPKRIGKSSLLHHLGRYHLQSFTVPAVLDLQGLPTSELHFPQLVAHLSELLIQHAAPRGRTAPLKASEITRDPIKHFIGFVEALRARGDIPRFVVLIDELGTLVRRLQLQGTSLEFFDQWRSLLNNDRIYPHLAFVCALPDASLNQIDPLRLGELGLHIRLGILEEEEARDLITTPIRMHLTYTEADLDRLIAETGGHPYYIHLVCGQIVTAVQAQRRKMALRLRERQEIPSNLVEEAITTIAANPDVFHHVTNDSTPATVAVLRAIAILDSRGQGVRRNRLHTYLAESTEFAGGAALATALAERPDLLVERNGVIAIRAMLVWRFLRTTR